jgi:hypothetical protein
MKMMINMISELGQGREPPRKVGGCPFSYEKWLSYGGFPTMKTTQ